MMALTQRSLAAGLFARLGPRRGIIRAHEIQVANQAADLLQAARQDADRIRREAALEAEQRMQDADRQAQDIVDAARRAMQNERQAVLEQAESAIWSRAAERERQLEQRVDAFLGELEEHICSSVRAALAVLLDELPPEARIRACVRQVLAQAGRPAQARLVVGEQDRAAVEAIAAGLPWPVEYDAGAPPAACTLVSTHGEWRCSFEGNIKRLLQVFEQASAAAGANVPASESGEGEHDVP
jgi:type III secretion protein L